MISEFKILVVDDEVSFSEALVLTLETEGYDVIGCNNPSEVPDIVQKEDIKLIISDLIMPEMTGTELLKKIKSVKPNMDFIILTAFGTIEGAVDAMKMGAFSYFIKGNDLEPLLEEISKIIKIKNNLQKTDSLNSSDGYTLRSESDLYKKMLSMAEKAAKSDSNILLLGESGAGKEVIAQHIFSKSKRSINKFITTNCHSFSNTLLESELFGHEKGAFTGALQKRIGLFEAAESGTLFLDEIGDVPLDTQAKLLRAIEAKKITRIGSNDEISIDFRLITATNKNLEEEIVNKSFREDLFYRISTIAIEIPPLRKRKEDIPHLIRFFSEKICNNLDIEIMNFPENVMQQLIDYSYPGNVRELKNIIERLIVLSDDGIVDINILNKMLSLSPVENTVDMSFKEVSLRDLRQEIESSYISDILEHNDFNIQKTADILDISTRHLFNKMAKYNIKNENNKKDS